MQWTFQPTNIDTVGREKRFFFFFNVAIYVRTRSVYQNVNMKTLVFLDRVCRSIILLSHDMDILEMETILLSRLNSSKRLQT